MPFSTAYMFDDPDDVYWCWEKLYKQVLDDHAPIKMYHRCPSTGSIFITIETRNAMRERDRLKKIFYKTRNPTDWEIYQQMRNRVTSMRRKAVQEHFRKLCDNNSSDQRKFWNTIKPYINSRKCKNHGRIVLKDNDNIITDQQKVAETLNDFFTSVAHAETAQLKPSPDLSYIADHAANTSSLYLGKTNPKEVKDILLSIKPNKATGYNLIPPCAVKQSADVLCYPLSTLVNYVLDTGKIPQQWKLGEVVPVYKNNCGLNKSNYRPLTILPSLSKVFERLMHDRVSPHFENIFYKYVFAYRKHHGCDATLLSLTEQWKKELDNHKIIGLVSMDLSKAFDTLPHELIVKKLRRYGADDKTTELFKAYLSNCRQRVKIGNSYSTWQDITAGIPQGSILGPVLFNIFMNDLVYVVKQSSLSAYTDDTQIFYADKDPARVEENINADLSNVDNWYKENGMKRNPSKYQAVVMGKTHTNLAFRCDIVIPTSEEFELLGVTVDNKLKFDKHTAKVCRKVSQQIAVLKRMRNMLPFEIRVSIYKSFIVPHFNYCAEVSTRRFQVE